ncbi:hypothetical protein [Shouchella hunanensis]|uniref:Uncharacterized protein n=1 Tax=Shouchella hunanensis TaxID=766894 RepID=A0ABY7W288_9BACI|nr:hypothetical protein [Shouchella hunanensis]WDF02974.1 hypothetical protein PQ477_15925 [Shouchella hunanensis]
MTFELKRVLSLLPVSMDKPIKCKEISKLTGYSESQVRLIIHTLVEKHQMKIGASNERSRQGYYIISNEDEMSKAVHNLESRIKAMTKRLNVLKQSS